MTAATETRYWVRATADAPEKGPFTVRQIKESRERDLLKPGALVRREDAEESDTKTVNDLLEEGEAPPARIRSDHFIDEDAERAAIKTRRSGGTTNMIIGGLCCGVGLLITLVSYSAASEGGGGRYLVCTGLIIFGAIRFITGVAQR